MLEPEYPSPPGEAQAAGSTSSRADTAAGANQAAAGETPAGEEVVAGGESAGKGPTADTTGEETAAGNQPGRPVRKLPGWPFLLSVLLLLLPGLPTALAALPFGWSSAFLASTAFNAAQLASWAAAALLMLAWPWLPVGRVRWTRYLALHFPLLFMLLFTLLSLRYDQRFELALREGQTLELQPQFLEAGFPLMQPASLELVRFEHAPGSIEDNKQSFTSLLRLNGADVAVGVNKPLSLELFQLYQMDWRLFVRSVWFDTGEGDALVALETLAKTGQQLADGSRFYAIPEKVLDDGVRYYWLQENAAGDMLAQGYFSSSEARNTVQPELAGSGGFWLRLLEEDFGYTSILQAVWKPFRLPLFLSGLLFLFGQALVFVPKAWRALRREAI